MPVKTGLIAWLKKAISGNPNFKEGEHIHAR
jgi:hypothetical protein